MCVLFRIFISCNLTHHVPSTSKVQTTIEPVDVLGENVGLSLTNRLGIARAKSGNMRQGDSEPPTPSTHKVRFSASTVQGSMDNTGAEERVFDEV